MAPRWPGDICAAKPAAPCGLSDHRRGKGGGVAPVRPAGRDVWLLRPRRSMDAPAPGDWTLQIRRDARGAVRGLTLGCWLARGLEFTRSD